MRPRRYGERVVRPVTAIVVVALLALIAGAFLIQLYSAASTP
jgi:hypothetical protein